MKAFAALLAATTATASVLSSRQSSVTPITIKGNAFFQGDNRFYIRGVDWQPGGAANPSDPLADSNSDACARDIMNFKTLGLNTVRVYTVDNSLGHDNCMNALAAAGIYLILDVNWSKYSLNRADNKSCSTSYNSAYLQNIFATMDAFAKYPNTMAFFSGNEVINDQKGTTVAAPYIKAVTRDMKQYLTAQKYRQIPVGYSGADVAQTRLQTAAYLNCGADNTARSDFFAFNDYSWCGESTFAASWGPKVQAFSNYSLPMFFSEYGCNTNPPRDFNEVSALYNPEMTGVFSGGLVYEYFQEDSNFGLVSADGTQYLPDFTALKNANSNNALPTGDGGYRSSPGGASACPATDDNWQDPGPGLPLIPVAAQKFMTSGAGKGVGLSGPGSQDGAGANVVGAQSPAWSTALSSSSNSAGSGTNTTTGGASSTSTNAAVPNVLPSFSMAPFAIAAVVIISSLAGGSVFAI